jgi:hypothetical protein
VAASLRLLALRGPFGSFQHSLRGH